MKDELNGKIIEEAYFLGIKQYGYYYYDEENKRIEKSVFAGVTRNSLSFQEIREISKGKSLKKDIQNRFFKSFNNLDVRIKTTKLTIKQNNDKNLINNNYIPKHIKDLNHDLDNRTLFNYLKNKVLSILKKFYKLLD